MKIDRPLNTNWSELEFKNTSQAYPWEQLIFPNGILLSFTWTWITRAIQSKWGNGYITSKCDAITYSGRKPFVGNHIEFWSAFPKVSTSDNVCSVMPKSNSTTTVTAQYYLYAPAPIAQMDWVICCLGVGKWK